MKYGSRINRKQDKQIITVVQLPIEPSYTTPFDNPAMQLGMGVITATFAGITPGGSAPYIARIIHDAGPANTITVCGNSWTGSTIIRLYGQTTSTNNTALTDLTNVRLSGNNCVAYIPYYFPPKSFYIAYPYDPTNGYGPPVLINKTEAQWLQCSTTGSATGVVGDTVRIHGRNLSNYGSPANSWIYVTPSGGGGQWVTATQVNPYQVKFTIPSLSNGNYEVWTHNGSGGKYGWSGPLTLTVSDLATMGRNYSSNSQTVSTTSDPTVDSSTAINTAISTVAAANAPGQIVLQAGTYYFGSTITAIGGFNNPIKIIGAGKGVTIIRRKSNFNADLIINFSNSTGEMHDLTIDTSDGVGTSTTGRDSSGVLGFRKLKNVAIDLRNVDNTCISADNTEVILDNCDITGKGIFFKHASNVLCINSNFYETLTTDAAITAWGGSNHCYENCFARDLNVNGLNNVRGHGRFIVLAGNFGRMKNIYVGNIKTSKLAAPDGENGDVVTDQNQGEQVLLDGGLATLGALLASATSNTVLVDASSVDSVLKTNSGTDLATTNGTSSTPSVTSATQTFDSSFVGRLIYQSKATSNWTPGVYKITSTSGGAAILDRAIGTAATLTTGTWSYYIDYSFERQIFISGGKGVGQYGDVINMSGSGVNIVFTLDKTFNVIPNNTSRMQLVASVHNMVVYGCNFNGKNNHNGPSQGFETFLGGTDICFDNNIISDTNYAWTEWSMSAAIIAANYNIPCYFNLFQNNTIIHANKGIRTASSGNESGQTFNLAWSIHRSNVFSQAIAYGLWHALVFDTGCDMYTFDGNTVSGDAPIGIYEDSAVNSGNCVLYNNSISIGAGTFSGSKGINSTPATSAITFTQSPGSGQFIGFQS